MRQKRYHYLHSCIESDAESIHALIDSLKCKKVTYRTMMRNCEDLQQWAINHKYDIRRDRGLTLEQDWNVGYFRSVYRGMSCYFLQYSGIEFIWILGGCHE